MRLFESLASCLAVVGATGCRRYNYCSKDEVCVWGKGIELGKCLPVSSNADFSGRNRRNEEMLQPTFGELDAAYQRQQRRKELLKEKLMAKRYQEAQEAELEKQMRLALARSLVRNPAPQVREPPTDDFAQDMMDDFAGVEEAMQKSFDKMSQDMAKMEQTAGSDPNSNFQSYKSSSYKVNDEPEEVAVETNNNGRINNYEEEIGADGKVKVLSASTESSPLEEVGEPMPQPAKRVSDDDAQFTRSLDQLDLFAMKEEKKAMILTFGAGGLLCAVLIVSGITLYATKKKKSPPVDFPAGDYEQLCRQHFAAKESQEISPTDWQDSKEGFNGKFFPAKAAVPNDELTVEQARSLLHASTEEEALHQAWQNANSSPSDESTNGGGEHPGKDRDPGYLPYETNRFKFNQTDLYYNASNVTLCDETWLLAQSPLPGQLSEFWTMIWESERTALVLLSPLQEDGMPQSARFWPNEGAELHGGIEVNLVTEHVWCREFLVRSLYLRQIETGETRTVTLLHYLGWPLNSTPPSAKRLLEFRRKARRAGAPVLICPDGASRAGAYCLIDALITAYANGKEPRPASLLESLRSQRMKSVRNEAQLNFITEAMAEAAESALTP